MTNWQTVDRPGGDPLTEEHLRESLRSLGETPPLPRPFTRSDRPAVQEEPEAPAAVTSGRPVVLRDWPQAVTVLAVLDQQRFTTREGLAEASGFAPISIRRWLTGRVWPYAPNLITMVNALGYDLVLLPREVSR